MARKCSKTGCDQPGLIKAAPKTYLCTAHAMFAEVPAAPLAGRAPDPAPSREVVLTNGTRQGIDLSALFPTLTEANIEVWRQQAWGGDE